MRLKVGTGPRYAVEHLDRVLADLSIQRGGGRQNLVDTYLRWAGDAEALLGPLFDDPDVAGGLQTPRYEALLKYLGEPTATSAVRLVYQEVEYQYGRLERVRNQLSELLRLGSRPGDLVAVYDTNSLIHYQPPNRIAWSEVFPHVDLVRVVVPLCVIAELDQKVYTGTGNVPERAGRASKAIYSLIKGSVGQSVTLTHPDTGTNLNASLEVLGEELGHHRLPQTDDEIISRATLLEGVTGKPVLIITHDNNMRIRAESAGMKTTSLLEKYKKDRPRPGNKASEHDG
jgi:PIN domain